MFRENPFFRAVTIEGIDHAFTMAGKIIFALLNKKKFQKYLLAHPLKLVGKEVEHMTIKWWLCTPLIMKRILGKSTKFYFDCRSSRSF